MPKFQFSKLVRDKIVELQIASGATPSYRVLSLDQHKDELVKKIIEESQEISHASLEDISAEIADVQQALDDLKDLYGVTSEDVSKEQSVKNNKNGAFKKGLYVNYVEVDDDNEWVAYYRENSERYPELDQSLELNKDLPSCDTRRLNTREFILL